MKLKLMTYFMAADLLREVYGVVSEWAYTGWIKQDELAAGIKKRDENQPEKPFQVLVVSYERDILDKPCNRVAEKEQGFKTMQEALLYIDELRGRPEPKVEAV